MYRVMMDVISLSYHHNLCIHYLCWCVC